MRRNAAATEGSQHSRSALLLKDATALVPWIFAGTWVNDKTMPHAPEAVFVFARVVCMNGRLLVLARERVHSQSLSIFLDTCVHACMLDYGRGCIVVCMFVQGAAPNSLHSPRQDMHREQSLKMTDILLGTDAR